MAVPSVKTNIVPNNTRKKMIGTNHHFLRTLRKSHNSSNIESFDIVNPYYFFNGITPSNLSLLEIAFATSRYPSGV